MRVINQKGKDNKGTTGDNSPIVTNSRITSRNLKNTGWFLTGLVLPVISGIILEVFKTGLSSDFLNKILEFFK
ncbi:hypothetical protein [Owenweeksia hongkongensis]|uniref:hypothetical protein n=1 Tax=Owenweeksia hongkongensis TaxID=253245 RepID=UPI003A8F8887